MSGLGLEAAMDRLRESEDEGAWMSVPVSASDAMHAAAKRVSSGYPYAPTDIPPLGHLQICLIWRAMLAAWKLETQGPSQ